MECLTPDRVRSNTRQDRVTADGAECPLRRANASTSADAEDERGSTFLGGPDVETSASAQFGGVGEERGVPSNTTDEHDSPHVAILADLPPRCFDPRRGPQSVRSFDVGAWRHADRVSSGRAPWRVHRRGPRSLRP